MATAIPLASRNLLPARRVATAATGESGLVRWTLIGVAVLFLGLFIFLPLAVVFSQAFAKGIGAYWASLRQPDALSAMRLTLLAAGISVPLNLVFGVAAAWAIGKFEFVGKSLLDHAHRSAVLGFSRGIRLDLCFAFRIAGLVGPLAGARTTCKSSSPCPESFWPPSS